VLFLIIYKLKNTNAPGQGVASKLSKFLILIPAHNEEKVLPRLLDSVLKIRYPKYFFSCIVICDNCEDNTEKIAIEKGVTALKRVNKEKKGKGYAIKWALDRINIEDFDVIIMTDADTIMDSDILNQLNVKFLDQNTQVVQCYNGVINPDDSTLTRFIELTRAMETIYMASRSYLGLTVPLIGNGMCFRTATLRKFPWKAFSIGEDLEYFCMLSVNGVRVGYSYTARVFLQEERKFAYAETQRQRWSSGRISLVINYSPKILFEGLKKGDIKKAEAAMTLLVQNPSFLGNYLVIAYMSSFILNAWSISHYLIYISFFLLFIFFISSFLIVKITRKNLFSILLVPIFLLWKGLIDIRAILGRKKNLWVKTERH
jgi:cellulose synthase/poly-beta-1,6-N-acetylglucosamine synthase-like glycosyltransferase